jgi:predicted O-methyltransferase YrrM
MTENEWFDNPRRRFVVSPHAVLRCRQGQLTLSSGSQPSTLVLHSDAMPLIVGLAKPKSLSALMNIPAKIPRAERPALLRKLVSAGIVEVRSQPAHPKGSWWDPYDRAREETTLFQLIQIAHGFTRSAHVGFCVDESGAPVPWLSRPVLDYLFQLDLSGTRVFEYGGGASTYYWVRHCRSVVCAESNRRWYERLRADLVERASLLLREQEQAYSTAILETEDLYDVILIDAAPRFRRGCAAPALKRLTPGGMIILDDAPFYADIAAELRAAGLIEVDLTGYSPLEDNLQTTALFLTRDFAIPRRRGNSPAFPFGSPGFRWDALERKDKD